MRITGGELRGRVVKVPPRGVRPTQERVREALFSMLGDAVVGARVWDVFAGSGALGIEAWSRGAAEVTWVEQEARTFRQLQATVGLLCGADAASRCVRADAIRYVRQGLGAGAGGGLARVDFILADPPYDRHSPESSGSAQLLAAVAAATPSAGSLRLVLEQHAAQPVGEAAGWQVWKNKTYGDTRLLIYRPDVRDGETRSEDVV
jgi:16S rRNA (guanine966-N2)-methyltransferase